MIGKKAKKTYHFIRSAIDTFISRGSMMLSAALAFYILFSLPPILIIIISIAGALLGEEYVRTTLFDELEGVFGAETAGMIQNMLESFQQDETGWAGTALWIGIMIFTATTFFVTMQEALNKLWDVRANPASAIKGLIRDRIMSFGLILSIAFLLLVSFVINTGLVMLSNFLQQQFPDSAVVFMTMVGVVLTVGISTVLFALIFRYLPDTIIRWKDVWLGAFVTAVLFELGRFLIGLYIGESDIASAYGAAGSVVILLIWVQYSSLILFFGAAITKQFTVELGGYILPQEHAVRVAVSENQLNEHKEKDKNEGRPPADGKYKK
jgi:membrane protein